MIHTDPLADLEHPAGRVDPPVQPVRTRRVLVEEVGPLLVVQVPLTEHFDGARVGEDLEPDPEPDALPRAGLHVVEAGLDVVHQILAR